MEVILPLADLRNQEDTHKGIETQRGGEGETYSRLGGQRNLHKRGGREKHTAEGGGAKTYMSYSIFLFLIKLNVAVQRMVSKVEFKVEILIRFTLLSKPQPQHNTTQRLGLTRK